MTKPSEPPGGTYSRQPVNEAPMMDQPLPSPLTFIPSSDPAPQATPSPAEAAMTHEEFMTKLLRPSFVWRSAFAMLFQSGSHQESPGAKRVQKGAPKRMANSQAEIDELVLARADEIVRERVTVEQLPDDCICLPGIELEMRPNPDCVLHGRNVH